jgi:hypothetical protein
MAPLGWRRGAGVLLVFVVLSLVQAWPLPARLSTHVTGTLTSDWGVYLWNTWVFRRELEAGRAPFTTDRIFAERGAPADLSLHNYTTTANLVALAVRPIADVVTAFNLIYLAQIALAGFGLFLLAHRVTGRIGEAVVAGLSFAWTPFLVARSEVHFSLLFAGCLPLFLWWLDRLWTGGRLRDAVGTGVTFAAASYGDPYYGVYCILLAALFVVRGSVTLAPAPATPRPRRALWLALGAATLVVFGIAIAGGGTLTLGGRTVSIRSLYTPVLILTVAASALVAWPRLARLRWSLPAISLRTFRAGAVSVVVAAVLLAPVLIALAVRAAEGRFVRAPVLWRSSPPGVDLAALAIGNPANPLVPDAFRAWLASRPGGYEEQVAGLSIVALAVLVWAWRRHQWRADRFWLAATIGAAWCALGPYVQAAGLNTCVPTPWTLLRYVPVVELARMPSRLAVVAALGAAVLLALALTAIAPAGARRRRLTLAGVASLIALELNAAPRLLQPAAIPAIYDTVAADARDVTVLELPYGIRDGLSSIGNFNASSQYFQTRHGKPLLGGYLSRVDPDTRAFTLGHPVLSALATLSEGRPLAADAAERARRAAAAFLRDARVGYVVVHEERASAALAAFAVAAFDLTHIATSGRHALYAPAR